MDTGSDPEVLLARMEWAESPTEVVIQRTNRIQNRVDVLLADAATGRSRTLFTETDAAWVDVHDDFHWLNGRAAVPVDQRARRLEPPVRLQPRRHAWPAS